MAGDTHWYVVIVSAYYSFIVGPIGKDYLFSSIQHRWRYGYLVMIIIEATIFFDVMVSVEIYCTGTTVLVLTFYYKLLLTEVFITDSLTTA